MARVEVITAVERRRRWNEEQKRAIVAESFAPGAVVSKVARRADVSPGQIYRWRQEMRAAVAGFAPLLIAAPDAPTSNGADSDTSMRFIGCPNSRQFARPQQSGEQDRVASIGLDAIARLLGNQRGSDDDAIM